MPKIIKNFKNVLTLFIHCGTMSLGKKKEQAELTAIRAEREEK